MLISLLVVFFALGQEVYVQCDTGTHRVNQPLIEAEPTTLLETLNVSPGSLSIKGMKEAYLVLLQQLIKSKARIQVIEQLLAESSLCTVGLGDKEIIWNNQFTASSYYSSYYYPYFARLNMYCGAGGWTVGSGRRLVGEWIQVDLLRDMRIAAIATQGKASIGEHVTSYSVQYKTDAGSAFVDVRDEQGNVKVFIGNEHDTGTVKRTFDEPFVARYFRVLPLTWYSWPTLRFELYKC